MNCPSAFASHPLFFRKLSVLMARGKCHNNKNNTNEQKLRLATVASLAALGEMLADVMQPGRPETKRLTRPGGRDEPRSGAWLPAGLCHLDKLRETKQGAMPNSSFVSW